ncbi:2-C-methyl-D-erythritol 4-phosphate cytidylyltransferase [Daejeonella lutea]|uniref:2-C-methyl-D-erythritol 4-phosphate cytidylyltransferase n=1 Tax=Daejeonella lutea TaxID=572036 RepID=A0A1T5B5D5_9SPHI|nr:2-C-methyl-D-erythritol 4-phosphate cytidylyltransferase [Daejeonella lutea]SKB42436.1 2-C-methyl-D-erythritol 4-phosphate cytidylyltransferase [Daejeonella lutea]
MPGVKYYAIIVGGGSGSRMQSDIPKQFLLLNNRPVLMHTIEAFHSSAVSPAIILVLSKDFHQYWKDLCSVHKFTIPHLLISGGQQRFHSVKNGLQAITEPGIVAVHDAVRPCISQKVIASAYKQAEEVGNAVVAVKSRDSVRQVTDTGTVSLNREEIYLIQTPQVFRSEILSKAYEQEYRSEFTDDASVVERSGVEIRLIEGDTKNLKITYPEDIQVAQAYLS